MNAEVRALELTNPKVPVAEWGHDRLAKDLHDRRVTNGEIVAWKLNLGQWGEEGEIDVVSVRPTWTEDFGPMGFEVKASRSDFLGDLRREKWRKYLAYTQRLYFATPAGMVSKDEVPEECGLMVRSKKGWSGVVAPRVRKMDPEDEARITRALVMNQADPPWRAKTREERIEYLHGRSLVTRWGLRVGNEVADIAEELKEKRDQVRYAKKRLAKALGYNVGYMGDVNVSDLDLEELVAEVKGRLS